MITVFHIRLGQPGCPASHIRINHPSAVEGALFLESPRFLDWR
jgi:hypothetical protein